MEDNMTQEEEEDLTNEKRQEEAENRDRDLAEGLLINK